MSQGEGVAERCRVARGEARQGYRRGARGRVQSVASYMAEESGRVGCLNDR